MGQQETAKVSTTPSAATWDEGWHQPLYLDRPLSRAWCLIQDTEFTTSNNMFSGLIKSLRRAITEEDLVVLRKSEAMNPNTMQGLVNNLWLTSSYILEGEERRV